MKKVAKLVIVDENNEYLLLNLNNHPTFGNDPDLPGGTLDDGETAVEGMIREVEEEVGVRIGEDQVKELYSGTDYSRHDTHYTLFIAELDKKPELTMSWEHTSYNWLGKDDFLSKASGARDTYMHMVCDILK